MDANPVRDEYDRLSPDYDRRWRPYIDATLNAVLKVLAVEEDLALLDIPCGTGELEHRLLAMRPNLRLTGVDVSEGMLEQARRKDKDRRVKWIEADVVSLPLSDQSFDCVVCANSFHYFRDPSMALSEMHRVLRPGGTLIMVDWCDDYLTCKACSLWLRWTNRAFYQTYSLQKCSFLVEQADLIVENVCRFRVNWLWGLMRVVCRRAR